MFARTTRLQLQPGKMDEFKRVFRGFIAPALQSQPGFRSIILLTDDASNKVLGMTQWATEADLIAIQTSGVNNELLGALRPLVAEPPVQESYAVNLQVEPI
jgi:heme-degrading monooxygenase HmoA